MKIRAFYRLLALALTATMLFGAGISLLVPKAQAATTAYKLAQLLEEGKIKPLGRTTVHEVSGTQYLATDWSGTGFEISLTHSEAQTLVLGYRASYTSYWAIHVDGKQIYRGSHGASSNGSIYVTVPGGTHTVSFIKETQLSDSETAYWDLSTLRLSGTVNDAPANKSLYIEFIGDSYSCGDGALGQYVAGKTWSSADDSATNGFPFYTAQYLNADYSIVARGGIGLFVGISEQEGTAQKKGIQDVYTYASGFRTGLGQYDFTHRQPNVVVVELGANDSIDSSDQYKTIAYWTGLLEDFTDTVREKNPNAHIVYLSHDIAKHKAMLGIVEARASSDPKLYALYYPHSGNGSAAKETQSAGHPSYSDHQELAKGLSNFISTSVLPQAVAQDPAYTNVNYYVSENGSDSNDGLTITNAKKTVRAAYDAAVATTLPAGSRLVLHLQGTVLYTAVGSNQALFSTTRKTADGKKLPILVTTYNYSGEKAILDTAHKAVNDGNASQCIYNDVTFRNMAIQSTTRVADTADGKYYRDRNLYCGYNNVVFDNVSFLQTVDSSVPADATLATGAWRVSGGFFGSRVPSEAAGDTTSTVTFYNGDYTGLNFATAVVQNSVGSSKEGTQTAEVMHCTHKLIIGQGAHMGTVYNRYGKLAVKSSTVEIRGGTVNQYLGTASGNTTNRFSTKGDVCFVMKSGTVKGERFITAGDYVTLDGNLINDISGGTIHIIPKGVNSQYYGFMLAGSNNVTVNNVTNSISGGRLLLESDNTYSKSGVATNVDAGFYFGGSGAASVQNVTNNISGGLFMFLRGNVASGYSGFHLGQHSGKIHGTLTNNISGGIFDNTNAGYTGSIYFGPRATNTAINKIVNVIGTEGTTKGPRFHVSDSILLGAGWGQVGITGTSAGSRDYIPNAADCQDTVVLQNTIHGGHFSGKVISSTNGGTNVADSGTYYCFVKGSVLTDVYGGTFRNDFIGAGNSPVFGHVTTNIHGGHFCSIYGARSGKIYDGVELNIYGMKEYWYLNNSYKLYAGGTGGTISVQTAGRPALALNIAPQNPARLVLNMPIYASGSGGTINGTITATVSGGTFPQGLAISGKTVGQVLASGKAVFSNPSGSKVSYGSSDSSISGSVIVANDGQSYSNELVYYVSENGDDRLLGHTPETAKKSLTAVYAQILTDNRQSTTFPLGTRATIYVSGQVVNNAGNSQILGGSQALYCGSSKAHMPITITTYQYSGVKATVLFDQYAINNGNGSGYVVNDNTFKDIELRSVANLATGHTISKLYAAGCQLTFDNASITTDGKATTGERDWRIGADHFSTGGFNPLNTAFHPHSGTLVFKNGDYTNILAAAVYANNIYQSSGSVADNPNMFCKLIIEEGAKMGTVYNAYGLNKVGSATVEIRGGTVQSYAATRSGTSSSILTYATQLSTLVSGGTVSAYAGSGDYVNITGNVTNSISGGTVAGVQFNALGNKVTLTGNLTNNISGGKLVITPTDTENNGGQGIFLSGRDNCTITGNVENNISGGELGVNITLASTQTGIWMGQRSGSQIKGNLTNNISGGTIYTRAADGITAEYASFHTGNFSGSSITGTLFNNITGGSFAIAQGDYHLGQQGVSGFTGSIVTILGNSETKEGPIFQGTNPVRMAGNFGRIGVSSNIGTLPDTAECSDTMVISNTIWGGTFGGEVTASVSSGNSTNVGYVLGSVLTNVYGGSFHSFSATGNAPVYGHVTTNIHGGSFDTLYGAKGGAVYDGVELNIYGMSEGSDPNIYAAGTTGTVSAVSAERHGVKLTIAPTGALSLSKTISAGFSGKGTNNGTTEVAVSGGTYPNGFAVVGVTVKEALAEGYCVVDDATGAPLAIGDKDTSSGTDSVTVLPMDESLRFSGASLKLYEDLAIIFKADDTCFGQDGYTDPYVKFYMGDKLLAVSEYSEDNGRLAFPFRNIAPQMIGDSVTATLYATKNGVLYAGKPVEYSVKQYCANMLTKASDHKALRTLLVDLLNYGAAAQTYAGHNTDKLVNADLTDPQKAWGTQGDPAVDNDVFTPTYATVENPTAAWQSGGLYLDDRICFRMTLEAADITDLSVKVELAGKSYSIAQEDLVPIGGKENLYYVYFDQLNAAQMRTPVLFTAYRGGVAVSHTIRYSIECYVADKQSNTETPNLADLVRSIIRYGDAAEAYIN